MKKLIQNNLSQYLLNKLNYFKKKNFNFTNLIKFFKEKKKRKNYYENVVDCLTTLNN